MRSARLSLALMVILTLAPVPTTAGQREEEGYGGKRARFQFERGERVFEVLVPHSALISEGCRRKAGAPLACKAADALRKVDRAMLRGLDTEGGPDPGIQLCPKLGGTVIIGTDAAGNQNGFCLFSDKSVTDTSGLLYYLYKPAQKPR